MRDLLWKEIFQPELVCRGVDPCFERVAVESVDCDDTVFYESKMNDVISGLQVMKISSRTRFSGHHSHVKHASRKCSTDLLVSE